MTPELKHAIESLMSAAESGIFALESVVMIADLPASAKTELTKYRNVLASSRAHMAETLIAETKGL